MIDTVLVNVHGLVLHQIINDDRRVLVAKLHDMTGTAAGEFPGPLPVSIERADFPKLRGCPYLLCEKTDGWRALLLTLVHRGKNIVVLFDRSLTPYLVPKFQCVPTVLFQTSLFDGEIARTIDETRRWTYLVFDALLVSGANVTARCVSARLKVATMAWEPCATMPRDTMAVVIKRMTTRETMGAFSKYLETQQARFRVDGIVLTPDIKGFFTGKHDRLFKLKTTHSVDFRVQQQRGLAIYLRDGLHKTVAHLSPESPEIPIGSIVECIPTPNPKIWSLLLVRTDKTRANNMLTFTKTKLNAAENVSIDEVLEAML